jgi:hypothetical protein
MRSLFDRANALESYSGVNDSVHDRLEVIVSGPPGPAGPQGPQGPQGLPGTNGINGTNGANAQSTRKTQTVNLTLGQTTVSVTGGYTVGLINIYLNGVRLILGQDVTATTGTTLTLSTPAETGDVLDLEIFGTFDIASLPLLPAAPTGTPSAAAGTIPFGYDVTNNKLWFYSGGVWRGVVAT